MVKEALATLLEKDEMVLWSGKPAPFKIVDKYYKQVLIRNYIIAILVFVLPIAWILVTKANINVIALIAIFCIVLAVLPFKILSYLGYRNNCNYYLTNKNIIVYLSEYQKMKFPLNDIDRFESIQQNEGTQSIRIGKAVGITDKKNLEYALNCLSRGTSEEKKDFCLLFNLADKDAKTVLELINKYRVVA